MIIKCKMCGGDLRIEEGTTVAECEYCGTKQTVPNADNEKKIKLFERANRLRAACEFDKAAGVYESIVADFDTEAEAYWGLILCKFGIEYVDDPATGDKVPTCHRSSFDSVLEDPNFELVMENSDAISRKVYRDEAKAIEELRRSIIEVSSKEEPYDVFISYKELDASGERTIDSVIAQDIYKELTNEGYRVFFSRISLESKLGVEYEPYIFAALNSARVMIVVGTDYDNFNAVWVKNEWSRYLALIASGQKKTLIPCFKNIDAYDMPREFNMLAAQNMGKIGAMQDLLRGVEKLLGKKKTDKQAQAQQNSIAQNETEALLNRAFILLEDGEWSSADSYLETCLDKEPELAEAYLGKLMVEMRAHSVDELAVNAVFISTSKNYQKAVRYSDPELKQILIELDKQGTKELEQISQVRNKFNDPNCSVSFEFTLQRAAALCSDDSVLTFGWNLGNTFKLKNAKMIATQYNMLFGLCADGTVAAYCENSENLFDVSNWQGMTSINSNGEFITGLREDGTVAACSARNEINCDILEQWTDTASIVSYCEEIWGICKNGTVNYYGKNVEDWKYITDAKNVVRIKPLAVGFLAMAIFYGDGSAEIVKRGSMNVEVKWDNAVEIIADCYGRLVVLQNDGEVFTYILSGSSPYGKVYDRETKWDGIVSIYEGFSHVVGLRSNGTVVAEYYGDCDDYNGQCNVSDWRNIIAVYAVNFLTVGIRADGSIVYCGEDEFTKSNPDWNLGWKLFDGVKDLEENIKRNKEFKFSMKEAANKLRAEKEKAAEETRLARIAELEKEKEALQAEIPTIKGLFAAGKIKKLQARVDEIETELTKLK